MPTNIDIDDELMAKAMATTGKSTKKDVVEEGLRLLVQTHRQASIRASRGKGDFWPEVATSMLLKSTWSDCAPPLCC